jgi:hypothetical protein
MRDRLGCQFSVSRFLHVIFWLTPDILRRVPHPVHPAYKATWGYSREVAIVLLRRFYMTENTNGPSFCYLGICMKLIRSQRRIPSQRLDAFSRRLLSPFYPTASHEALVDTVEQFCYPISVFMLFYALRTILNRKLAVCLCYKLCSSF